MQTCEFCGAENTEQVNHCVSCGEPLSAAAAAADVKVTDEKTHKQLVKNEILWGALGLGLVGALGYAGVHTFRQNAVKAEIKTFYTAFRDADDRFYPSFWKCIARTDKTPKDNIELSNALEAGVVKSKGDYAKFASSKCLPLVANAPAKLTELTVPPSMAETYTAYVDVVKSLEKDAQTYISTIGHLDTERQRDAVLAQVGANYHFDGKESAVTYAYDKFLRCAVPNFQGMADEQPLLEYLGTVMKDPQPTIEHWRKDCYPIIEKTDGATADPDYAKKVESFSSDDRDVQAFQDVLKAGFEKQRKAASEPVEKAWFRYAQARDALTGKFGDFLSD